MNGGWRTLALGSIVWLLLGCKAAAAPERAHATPEEETTALMNAVVPVAEKMLGTTGEFYPYGGAMMSDGSIQMVAAYDGDTRPGSQALIDMLEANRSLPKGSHRSLELHGVVGAEHLDVRFGSQEGPQSFEVAPPQIAVEVDDALKDGERQRGGAGDGMQLVAMKGEVPDVHDGAPLVLHDDRRVAPRMSGEWDEEELRLQTRHGTDRGEPVPRVATGGVRLPPGAVSPLDRSVRPALVGRTGRRHRGILVRRQVHDGFREVRDPARVVAVAVGEDDHGAGHPAAGAPRGAEARGICRQ